jgi:hypothetical protein
MDDTAEVCMNKVKVATARYPSKNMVAIKYSALGDYEAIKQCNIAQNNVTDFFIKNCKRLNTRELSFAQVRKIKINEIFIPIKKFMIPQLKDSLRALDLELTEEDINNFFKEFIALDANPESRVSLLTWKIKMHSFYIGSSHKSNNKVLNILTKMDQNVKPKLKEFADRLDAIFSTADKFDVILRNYFNIIIFFLIKCRVMVDAEQTYLQRTIDSFTEQFQYK